MPSGPRRVRPEASRGGSRATDRRAEDVRTCVRTDRRGGAAPGRRARVDTGRGVGARGILNVDITEDIVHILTGGLLAYT